MSSIGLFFGSFDPVHNGHLAIARYLLDEGYCEKVWFIISPCNPWKEGRLVLDEYKRLEIVQAAIAGDQRMQGCDIEFTMPRPSYTFQTLLALSKKYPEEDFALILGGDNYRNFHLWKNPQDILANYRLLVYPRPDEVMPEVNPANVIIVPAPTTTLSSTEIREKMVAGEEIRDLVPASVSALILNYYLEGNKSEEEKRKAAKSGEE